MFEKSVLQFVGALVVATLLATTAQTETLEIRTVRVPNEGNADDTHGYGGVSYVYAIGKYEVSNAEYTEFLNAVDPNGTNPHDLYNSSMGSGYGGITFTAGNPSGSKYAERSGRGEMPVNYVSFWDACRFVNWLHNGQGSGDTESGAYTLSQEAIWDNTVARNADWLWAVPTEDEWYKAAYYDGDSAVYYNYPTRSNMAPTAENAPGTDDTNGSANYDRAVGDLTDVGSYTSKPSDSPYGTYDQGGNVSEWNEAIIKSVRGLRGGSFRWYEWELAAAVRGRQYPPHEDRHIGFRVASIPEPGSITLFVCGLVAGFIWWRRTK